jgi:hypothetical protein
MMPECVSVAEIREVLGVPFRIRECKDAERALNEDEKLGLKALDRACFNGRWEKKDSPGFVELKCSFNNHSITLTQSGDPIRREHAPSDCIYSCNVSYGETITLLHLEDSIVAKSRCLFVLEKHFGI